MTRATPWDKIAEQYLVERDTLSFNAVLLDEYVYGLAANETCEDGRALDVGAGNGVNTRHLLHLGWNVTAVEPNEHMGRLLFDRVPPELRTNVQIETDLDDIGDEALFDLILCLNVLDHVQDFEGMLLKLRWMLAPRGLVVVSVPHPLKDLGDWEKTESGEGWQYLFYRLDGYLDEGVCAKTREDSVGNVVVEAVNSYHRTISTYYNALIRAAFHVTAMREPKPRADDASRVPVLFSKCSRVPYFLVFECRASCEPRATR